MKVIDLLNKIANGEKPPKYILIVGHRYRFNEKTNDYDRDIGMANKYLFKNMGILSELNEEIKILEDTIEELHLEKDYQLSSSVDWEIQGKINELVRAVNKLKGGKNE